MSARAVVLTHGKEGGPALVGEALAEVGFELEVRFQAPRLEEDAAVPLLVVMGGSMGVYEAESHPYLLVELDVLRRRLAAGRPTLGICLGSQLLAQAAGSRVYPGPAGLELGAPALSLAPEAKADPVFGDLEEPVLMPQWHGDTFDPVPGAALLASSEMYRWQAFRLGNSYGVQFHPELDAARFRHWLGLWASNAARANKPARQVEAELRALEASAEVQQRFRRRLAEVLSGLVSPGRPLRLT